MSNNTDFNDGQTFGLALGTMLGLTIGAIIMGANPSMPLDLTCAQYEEYVDMMSQPSDDYDDMISIPYVQ
tara:strand:+ start:877 stop:1086 length:210 start_codon:yes stop_codon:yes gene_type:complete